MENRFGFKDLVLMTLLFGVIGVVILAMFQFDRQNQRVVDIATNLNTLSQQSIALSQQAEKQTAVLNQIRDQLAKGIVATPAAAAPTVSTPTTPTTPAAAASADTAINIPTGPTDPFGPLREARSKPDFKQGDWYIANFGTRIGKITPLVSSDVYGSEVQARIQETLLTRDSDTLKWKPLLAESYEIQPDGKSVIYKLRKGIKFSDGVDFTAKDVVFTFQQILNPKIDAARARSSIEDVGTKVEALDDYTVKFTLLKPYYEMISLTGYTGILPEHFYSKFTPGQFNETPGLLMGTGPYRLANPETWKPGTRLELLRNDYYWGVKPAFDKLIYLEITDETAAETTFTNGEMDYLPAVAKQYNKLKDDKKVMANSQALNYYNMLGGYTYVAWNQKKKNNASGTNVETPFADKRVRQAMTMLIDREKLAAEIYKGYARPATGPFSRSGRQADPKVEPWPYDPERAKKLLATAGFKDVNGTLMTADGKPFKFELMFPGGSSFSEQIALFIKDQLAEGGVQVELRPTDWPALVEKLKNGEFEATTLGWSASVESDLKQIFHSSEIKPGGDNRTSYASPELDKAIDAARACIDEDQRMKLWNACHDIIAEDQPYTFLVERQTLRLMSNRIQNIKKARMGLNYTGLEVMPLPWYSNSLKYSN